MKQPNILMVFPDQFNSRAMGFKNDIPVETPNLDKLAEDSLVLTNAISNQPLCSPYRAMLMTGRYPWKTGVTTNCHTGRNVYGVYLKKNERCLTDVLAENGYDTGYIGKWHLDPPAMAHYPYINRGEGDPDIWDSYTMKSRRHQIDFWHTYGTWNEHLDPHYWVNDAPFNEPIHPKKWSVEHEADVAIDYINNKDNARNEEKPFVLFVANNPPHNPYEEVPQKYKDMYKDKPVEELLCTPNFMYENPPEAANDKDDNGGNRAVEAIQDYLAAITGIDENLGRIIQSLKDKGIYDDTIIIFTSDHGDLMGSHNMMGKAWWFAESLKVPFIIRYPKMINKGETDFVLNVPDIMPTLLSMCGLESEIPSQVQGENKVDHLTGKTDKETSGVYLNFRGVGTICGLKTVDKTFVCKKTFDEQEEFLLYDDINDPYQLKEMAKDNMSTCEKMNSELNTILDKLEFDRC